MRKFAILSVRKGGGEVYAIKDLSFCAYGGAEAVRTGIGEGD